MFLDVTKRFPFDDCTFDYIMCEHLIEHLQYKDGLYMLSECFRVLKPFGKIRISTPDLHFLIELYSENKTDLQERYIRSSVDSFLPDVKNYSDTFVINNFFQAWGHKFIYDYKTLKNMLENSGFINVTRHNVLESTDENLRGIELHGNQISEEFNKLESLILEAQKPEKVDI